MLVWLVQWQRLFIKADEKRTIPKEWIKKAWEALEQLGNDIPEWKDDKALIQWYERRKNDEI